MHTINTDNMVFIKNLFMPLELKIYKVCWQTSYTQQ